MSADSLCNNLCPGENNKMLESLWGQLPTIGNAALGYGMNRVFHAIDEIIELECTLPASGFGGIHNGTNQTALNTYDISRMAGNHVFLPFKQTAASGTLGVRSANGPVTNGDIFFLLTKDHVPSHFMIQTTLAKQSNNITTVTRVAIKIWVDYYDRRVTGRARPGSVILSDNPLTGRFFQDKVYATGHVEYNNGIGSSVCNLSYQFPQGLVVPALITSRGLPAGIELSDPSFCPSGNIHDEISARVVFAIHGTSNTANPPSLTDFIGETHTGMISLLMKAATTRIGNPSVVYF